jgi:hypothetical protein
MEKTKREQDIQLEMDVESQVYTTESGESYVDMVPFQLAYELKVSALSYEAMTKQIARSENPSLGLYAYRFEFVRLARSLLVQALNHKRLDEPYIINIFKGARESFLFGTENALIPAINGFVDRCNEYAAAYTATENRLFLEQIADELGGLLWINETAMPDLFQAAYYLKDDLPDDAYIGDADIIPAADAASSLVNSYRQPFYELSDEAQNIVRDVCGQRYSSHYFPYPPQENKE